jgi:hypothetical protein
MNMTEYKQSPCSIQIAQSGMPDWLKDAFSEIDDQINKTTAMINDKMSAKQMLIALERINGLQLAKKIVFQNFDLTQ